MAPSNEDEVGFTSRKWVWFPDEMDGFHKGYIIESDGDDSDELVKVQDADASDTFTVNRSELQKVNPPKFDKCDNMASLTYLNEPSVLHNLKLRYQDDSIYTYSGLFLVAINPYKELPIYSTEYVEAHHKATSSEDGDDTRQPHIFGITEDAFQNLISDRQNQSILVTGESGAGKTENTKKVIQYLTSISASKSKDKSSFNFEQKILEANPILESFGNSQTLKNNNSSRFGKFIKLEFDPSTKQLKGANIEWYLLEKSRVIHQHPDERNYHIFYQMLAGLSEHELKALGLSPSVSDFNYLKDSNFTIPGVDDKSTYNHLIEALKTVNFELKEIANIIKTLAVILLLGNIEFANHNDKQAILSEGSPIEELCKLLEIQDKQAFINCFIKPKVKAGREYVTQQKTSRQAKFAIDALSKSLYEKLFGYIVAGINKSFVQTKSSNHKDNKFIGILDIAGFEIFPKNSFEQLCINYTNEKLQQFFNHHMFVLEQKEYLKENIEWEFIDFGNDLVPTIELIEKKKKNEFGIFAILDEECIVPNASDASFLHKLNEFLESKNKSVDKSSLKYRPNKNRSGFIVKHYAGEVEYDTEGWLDKNRDPLTDAVVELINSKSTNLFIKKFYKEEVEDMLKSQNSKKHGNGKKSSMLRTVADRHKTQLNDLMTQLSSTNPHFVRCILPNTNKKAGEFDNKLILDQLRCNGVLEGIRIARAGFPNRIEFAEFFQRYKVLCKNQAVFSKNASPSNMKQNCELLLGELKLDVEIFKVGSTKLFFKNGVLADLEKIREHAIEELMVKFQAVARGSRSRNIFKTNLKKLQAAQLIAENFTSYNELKGDPWFSLFVKLKPLIDSSDGNSDKKIFNEKIKKLREEITSLKKDNSSMKTETNQFNSKMAKIESNISEKEKLLKSRHDELQKLKDHEVELEASLSAKVIELAKLKDELVTHLEENEKLKDDLTKSLTEVKNYKDLIVELNANKDSLNKEIEKLSTDLEEAKSKHSKSVADCVAATQELKALKESSREKEQKIKELEKTFEETSKALELKISNSNKGYNLASKQLKDAITEKNELQAQLSKLKVSGNGIDNVIKNKEQDMEKLSQSLSSSESKVSQIERERDEMTEKYKIAEQDLSSANEALKKLTKKHQKLQYDLEQSRSLLNSKIEDDVKFGRGQQIHDRDILELKETIIDLRDRLTSNSNGDAETASTLKSLKFENEQLLKMKKSLDIKIAELTFQIRNRPGSIVSYDDADQNLKDEYNSLKLALNETNASSTKVSMENKHLKEELSLVQTRLASESYENRQLKAELNKILKADGNIVDENSWSPRITGSPDRAVSREASELRLQLDSEKRASKRIELLNIALQKELLQYKNKRYSSDKRLSGYDEAESGDYESKYHLAQARIASLEKQLKETISTPLTDLTQSFVNNASSVNSRSVSTIQSENLRLNAKLNELNSELKRLKSTSVTSNFKEEEYNNLKSKLEIFESTNSELMSTVNLYKTRAAEYYSKLEAADVAVKSVRRSEEHLQREREEFKNALDVLQKESKVNDNKIIKLNSQIRELEQKLSDANFENMKLSKNLDHLSEKHAVEEEFRSSTSSQASLKHEQELKQLNDELKEKMEHETEMGKTIKYLSLELDDFKNRSSNSAKQVMELSQQKSALEKLHQTVTQEKDRLSIRQREMENKMETLVSQVSALRSINEDIIVERDQLLVTKQSLEAQVKSVTEEFDKYLAKNNEEIANRVSVNEMQKDLRSGRETIEKLEASLEASESRLHKLREDHNSLKQDSITMIEENKALTKFNRQLSEKLKDIEQSTKSQMGEVEEVWKERLKKLENKIEDLNESKINEEQKMFNLNKLSKDLKNKYEEQLFLTSRYRKENDELDRKINELGVELGKSRKEEARSILLAKQYERQANEYKETSLDLEKELLSWKNR